MSQIGKLSIPVPAGVQVDITGNHVAVNGPRGNLERDFAPEMKIVLEDGSLRVERPNDDKRSRELHGLSRTLLNNMVVGVTDGYRKGLEITGVGYRAQLVAASSPQPRLHPPGRIDPPEGMSFEVEAPIRVAVLGHDKELVGHIAAKVRATRKPEPYKGKGIRYAGEVIRRKAGKAGKIGGKK